MTTPLRTSLILFSCIPMMSCTGPAPVIYQKLESAPKLSPNRGKDSTTRPYKFEPRIDWRAYGHTRLETVEIYQGDDSQFHKISDDEKRELAQYMYQRFSQTLAARDHSVSARRGRSLRVKLTLTGARKTTPVIGVMSRFNYFGAGYNMVRAAQGKQGSRSGYVVYAIEVTDASSGDLLYATIEKRYPNAIDIAALIRSLDASKAGIRRGCEEFRRKLEEEGIPARAR